MDVFTEEMYESDDVKGLRHFLVLVQKGRPWRIPTERLLRLNGNWRRGKNVILAISEALKEHGLVCTPTLDNADYYGDVVISDPRDELPERGDMASLPLSVFPSTFDGLVSCGRTASALSVQTKMVSLDISQVPVLSSDRKTVYGVITWKSIAQSSADIREAKATEVMSRAGHVASSADDFLELVDEIIEHEYVLYRVPDGRVNGIVTASDLARAFEGTAGIYIKLQEVENRVRILLDRSSIPDLARHLETRRSGMKKFRGATDMMFGEYISALNDKKIWNATGLLFDQKHCVDLLEKVKDVRNGVMHFSSNSEDDADSSSHSAVSSLLRILRAAPHK